MNTLTPPPALAGLKVLDLSRLLPGPYMTMLFADLGADVIKIEAPGGGDWVRYVPPLHRGTSVQFIALNRGKRSLGLDLKSPEGLDVFLRLVATADVVVESFRPGVMDRLGVGYDALSAINPRLVFAALSGYGQSGPYRDRAGHDLDYVALSGTGGVTGDPGGPPRALGFQVADLGGALFGAIGVLAALVGRVASGRGRFIDVALSDGALAFNALSLPSVLAGQRTPRGLGLLDGAGAGYRYYETRDHRFMAVAPLEPKFWAAFCEAMGRPEWGPRQHGQNEPLGQEIAEVFASRTRAEWEALFGSADACVEPVLELDELDGHPLHVARQQFFDLVQGGSPVRQVRSPVLDPVAAPAVRPAPHLGEHTSEVLTEAGYDASSIATLRARHAVHGDFDH